jgi:hypothetical protein
MVLRSGGGYDRDCEGWILKEFAKHVMGYPESTAWGQAEAIRALLPPLE